MLTLFIRLFFLFPFLIFAANDEPSAASTEGLPSNLVGQVCVITGEYVDHEIDLAIPGPESLVYERFYGTHNQNLFLKDNQSKNWTMASCDVVELWAAPRKDVEHLFTNLQSASGARLKYAAPSEKSKNLTLTLDMPKGFVNGVSTSCGRSNVKNQKVEYNNDKERLIITTAEGSKKRFKRLAPGVQGQIAEEKPNGHVKTFDRNDHGKLQGMSLRGPNGKEYSSIKAVKEKGGQDFSLIASNGVTAHYHFAAKKHDNTHPINGFGGKDTQENTIYYLKSVERSNAPTITYEHIGLPQEELLFISKKKVGNQYLITDYYLKGTNKFKGLPKIEINDKEDPRLSRVRQQREPVGPNGECITTRFFIYNGEHKSKKSGKEIAEGNTDVYDAYLHKTNYEYNKHHRLKTVTEFSGSYPNFNVYRKNKYVWGSNDSDDEGNLRGKILTDIHQRALKAHYFKYDKQGNLIRERSYGKFTSLQAAPLVIEEDHYPAHNGCECQEKNYTYSSDGLNLLLSEKDNCGKETVYTYKPGTDLIASKMSLSYGKMKTREFYEYNEDAVLVKKVMDNGIANQFNDLSGVTERHSTNIYPRQSAPYGFAERMDEMYADESGQEQLLKREVYDYSPQGYLLRRKTYGSDGQFAFEECWEYDAHGNVTKEVNAGGYETIKAYDEQDNLIMVHGPRKDLVTRYEYDACHRLIKQEDTYEGRKYVTTYFYDYLGNCTTSSNWYGQETHFKYDEWGRVVQKMLPMIANENGEFCQPTETNRYNELDQLVAVTDAKGRTTQTEYTTHGKPLLITYSDGSTEAFIYNFSGTMRQKTEKSGTYTVYDYDDQDRITDERIFSPQQMLLKHSRFEYEGFHLARTIDPEGIVTQYQYDRAGRLIKTIKGNRETHQFYDTLGRVSEIHELFDTKKRIHRKVYDTLNRVVEERTLDDEGNIYLISQFTYDEQGNQISIKSGDCGTSYTYYNPFQLPIKKIDAVGNETEIFYSFCFSSEHGFCVLKTSTVDPQGYKSVQLHDTQGKIVENYRENPFGKVIAHQRIFYDLGGNKCKQVDSAMQGSKVLRKSEICWSYNDQNLVDTLIQAANTPDQKIIKYRYNGKGQLEAKIKPDGIALLYEYDPLGRLKTFKSSDGSISYSYTYNLNDLPIQISDGTVTTTRQYDIYGQLIHEELGNHLALKYSYDQLGHATTVQLPDQSSIQYIHNAMDLKEVRRLVGENCVYSHLNISHDRSGHVTQASLPGQKHEIHYAYDSLGRCVKMNHTLISQNIPETGFDRVGNLLSYNDGNEDLTFEYDEYYQLKSEKGHQYTVDSLSNRTVKDGQGCAVNRLNQLLHQGNEKFEYDVNGNLIKRTTPEGEICYRYDALDRLVTVVTKNGEFQYTYDPLNRRLSKQEKGKSTTSYFYQNLEEIGAYENDVLTELKVLGDGRKRRMIAVELHQKAFVPIQDLFGHPICLLDMEGNSVERYAYTAFGEETSTNPINPWRYAGKRKDAETGFVAFGMRYYDPGLGRWITADPIGYEDGPNLYVYLQHNPKMHFDAFGLMGEGYNWEGPGSKMGLCNHFYYENDVKYYSSEHTHQKFNQIDEYPKLSGRYDLNHVDFKSKIMQESTHTRLVFNNGILNTKEDFKKSLSYLGTLTKDINVHGIYAASLGFIPDIIKHFLSRNHYYNYEAVKLLHEEWDHCFATAGEDDILVQICHSRGATDVRNALMSYPPELRKRIHVVAVAPATFIDKSLCGSIIHYVSNGDLVPFTDKVGMDRCKDTIVFLDPHPSERFWGWLGLDHSFTSETYNAPLRLQINKHLRRT